MWLAGSYLQSDWVMSGPGEFWWRLRVTQREYTMKKVPADINLEGPLTGRGGKNKQTRELKDTFIVIASVCKMKAMVHKTQMNPFRCCTDFEGNVSATVWWRLLFRVFKSGRRIQSHACAELRLIRSAQQESAFHDTEYAVRHVLVVRRLPNIPEQFHAKHKRRPPVSDISEEMEDKVIIVLPSGWLWNRYA